MLIVFVRTLVLYLVVIIAMRIMGKRQIGQLQPFELAVAIMISELASVPMQNTGIPLVNGIIPILTILTAQIAISFIALKSYKARNIICGTPSMLITKGKLNEDIFRKELYSLTDMLEQLRNKDIYNISDVEYAILETNGQLSIIPKATKRGVTTEDMQLKVKEDSPALDIIIDGTIITHNIKGKYNMDWLNSQLKKHNIKSAKDIFFANVGSDGTFFYQVKKKA